MINLKMPKDFSSKFEVAGCYVEYDGKILILHRHENKPQGNTWSVPACKIGKEESALMAVLRELWKGIGLKVHGPNLSHFNNVFVRYPEFDFVYHMYKTILPEAVKIKIDPFEHIAYEWVRPEEALQKNLIPGEDTCIKLHYSL